MKENIKNILSFAFRFVLSFGILFWIFSKADIPQMLDVVRSADIAILTMAGLVFILVHFIVLYRWYVFVKAVELDVPFMTVFNYFFIGMFGNLFLPSAIGGDMLKAYGLFKEHPEDKSKVLGSILLDRLFGFVGIALIALVSFLLGWKLVNIPSVFLAIAVVAIVPLSMIVILFHEGIYTWCCSIFKIIPRVRDGLMRMHYDVALVKNRKSRIVWCVALSIIAQFFFGISYYYIGKALHLDTNVFYFIIFTPIVCVVSMLPSIGGLGVRELGWVYFLALVGVSESIAASISLLSFAFMMILGVFGGMIYVTTLSDRRVQRAESNPAADAAQA